MKICRNRYRPVSVSTAALRSSIVHIFYLLYSCTLSRCCVLSRNVTTTRISDKRACLFLPFWYSADCNLSTAKYLYEFWLPQMLTSLYAIIVWVVRVFTVTNMVMQRNFCIVLA